MHSFRTSILVCVIACSWITLSDAVMGSMVGGTINWRLDDLFEDNHRMHRDLTSKNAPSICEHRIETAFDRSDGLGSNTGTILQLFQVSCYQCCCLLLHSMSLVSDDDETMQPVKGP
eukprot:1198226-Rhodomonas_salina.2